MFRASANGAHLRRPRPGRAPAARRGTAGAARARCTDSWRREPAGSAPGPPPARRRAPPDNCWSPASPPRRRRPGYPDRWPGYPDRWPGYPAPRALGGAGAAAAPPPLTAAPASARPPTLEPAAPPTDQTQEARVGRLGGSLNANRVSDLGMSSALLSASACDWLYDAEPA
eukprot:6444784-Pyramimonas_sp.AAC.1